MRYGMGTLATILIWFALALPAGAQGEKSPPIPNPDEVIKHCWDISLELRSLPGIRTMEEGMEHTVRCLEDSIKENVRIITMDESVGYEGKTVDGLMDVIRGSLLDFYDNIYYRNKSCVYTCGNGWGSISRGEITQVYEMMLRSVLSHREWSEKNFPPSSTP